MLPLGIVGGGDQLEVIHGDAYYQSYICRIPRSTIELGVSGRLDFVDGMLFPSICDVIRNLSGMWKMMFPHVYSHYFDVPQNYRDDIGGKFYVNEMAELRARSRRAARQADHRRRAARIRSRSTTRTAGWCAISTPSAPRSPGRRRRRKSIWCCAPAWCCRSRSTPQLLRDYLAAARAEERPMRDNCRIVLTGMFCEQPPLNLIKSLELSGCYVVDDDLLAGHPLAHRRRRARRRSAARIFRMPSCIIPSRRRPSTNRIRRKRASIWCARSSAPAPKA